jgi:phosphatidylinositol alpha-1,6-mannosyltransferase
VIANSSFTASMLSKLEPGIRSVVVPCGVDERTIVPDRSTDPTVLFVGRLVSRKGADRVIEILPRLLERFPRLRFEIVGDGPDRARLEVLSARLGVTGAVAFLGALPDADRDRAYARAWCLAMPARNEDGDVEGFGIVYLEAAMASLPTIGARESGADDAIVHGRTGFLVREDDRDELTARLTTLLSDRESAERMGAAGRRRALAQFSWERNATEIARVLELRG